MRPETEDFFLATTRRWTHLYPVEYLTARAFEIVEWYFINTANSLRLEGRSEEEIAQVLWSEHNERYIAGTRFVTERLREHLYWFVPLIQCSTPLLLVLSDN